MMRLYCLLCHNFWSLYSGVARGEILGVWYPKSYGRGCSSMFLQFSRVIMYVLIQNRNDTLLVVNTYIVWRC